MNTEKMAKSIVLLSGGLDSTTTLAVAVSMGLEVTILHFQYGQHKAELEAIRKVSEFYSVKSVEIVEIGIWKKFNRLARLVGKIPKNRDLGEIGHGIPITYIPARNTIFLSYALALAEIIGATGIFIGVNSADSSGYPDCRPEYIEAFERMANLGTESGVEGNKIDIKAPLLNLKKHQIVKLGVELGVDFSLTHSCYDPSDNNEACGKCDSCILRKEGFNKAGIMDPIKYYK